MSISVERRNGRLVVTLPDEALEAADAVSLLEAFAKIPAERRSVFLRALAEDVQDADSAKSASLVGLSAEHRRYLSLVTKGLRQRDPATEEFTDADLYALTEAARLGISLTARQRLTLIQYYIDRERFSPPQPRRGQAGSQSLNRMAAFARTLRKKA